MKKHRSTSPTSKRMTRKAALAELFQLRTDWYLALSHAQFEAAFEQRNRTSEALRVVTRMVLGPRRPGQFTLPCAVCYGRYAEEIVYEQGKTLSTWCCTSCRDRLREEGKLHESVTQEQETNPL